ncbi:MAG TPA: BBP7 family outer membrane beta-barrel protein, partial [Gemmataceae bacterium]|nr:BBP7 family outer membrane beta-barrel protein [Gemmataceae bacterium]
RGPAMIGEEMHWIVGVRYFGLEESLAVESMTQGGGMRVGTFDSFATRNQFYGGQFGGRWSLTRDNFTIDLILKLAVGGMGQEVVVQGGSSAVMGSGARVDRPGGLLALQSNIGDYDRVKFVIIRDTQLNVNYCLTENISLRLGYTFMWVSNVVRPGEHVDMGINPSLLPFSGAAPQGPIRPTFKYDGDVFWMHGINVGVTIRF